jgi:hypothetical protein
MIYVVVKEQGEYSDYSKTNMFASTSFEVASAKLAEYHAMEKRLQQAISDFHQYEKAVERETPMPDYRIAPYASSPQAYAACQDMRNLIISKRAVLSFRKATELAIQYQVNERDIRCRYDDDPDYSIDEVESD